jgi:hypothetical protein
MWPFKSKIVKGWAIDPPQEESFGPMLDELPLRPEDFGRAELWTFGPDRLWKHRNAQRIRARKAFYQDGVKVEEFADIAAMADDETLLVSCMSGCTPVHRPVKEVRKTLMMEDRP